MQRGRDQDHGTDELRTDQEEDAHEPLRRMATQAGFCQIDVTALGMVRGWETSPGSELPYALVGYRPPATNTSAASTGTTPGDV